MENKVRALQISWDCLLFVRSMERASWSLAEEQRRWVRLVLSLV